jgi:perosamine synthetase
MKSDIPFYLPSITEDEITEVIHTLKSGWLTTGPKVRQFEEAFRDYVGCSYAIALNSCTAALHLALDAIGVSEGDEIILPTMTFSATGEVVTYFRAKPVLVDVAKDTLLMDVDKIEEKITDKTKAIIPVHYAGQPCDMDKIKRIASEFNLRVIEDAAHSLPASYKGEKVGSLGDITCFSFYATKTITTGEGGMACTENPQYAERIKIMSLHGISRDAWKRYAADGSWYYEVIEAGYKYNMTDVAASMGLAQLKKCDMFLQRRNAIVSMYSEAFKDVPEIEIPKIEEYGTHAWHLYVIQLNLEKIKINRSQFIEIMKNKGIGCSVHFIPLHLHPYYIDSFGYTAEMFPNSTHAYKRIVSLPLYPRLTDAEVNYVIHTVKKTIQENT